MPLPRARDRPRRRVHTASRALERAATPHTHEPTGFAPCVLVTSRSRLASRARPPLPLAEESPSLPEPESSPDVEDPAAAAAASAAERRVSGPPPPPPERRDMPSRECAAPRVASGRRLMPAAGSPVRTRLSCARSWQISRSKASLLKGKRLMQRLECAIGSLKQADRKSPGAEPQHHGFTAQSTGTLISRRAHSAAAGSTVRWRSFVPAPGRGSVSRRLTARRRRRRAAACCDGRAGCRRRRRRRHHRRPWAPASWTAPRTPPAPCGSA